MAPSMTSHMLNSGAADRSRGAAAMLATGAGPSSNRPLTAAVARTLPRSTRRVVPRSSDWSSADDGLLASMVRRYGHKWRLIRRVAFGDSRSASSIKCRYERLQRRVLGRGVEALPPSASPSTQDSSSDATSSDTETPAEGSGSSTAQSRLTSAGGTSLSAMGPIDVTVVPEQTARQRRKAIWTEELTPADPALTALRRGEKSLFASWGLRSLGQTGFRTGKVGRPTRRVFAVSVAKEYSARRSGRKTTVTPSSRRLPCLLRIRAHRLIVFGRGFRRPRLMTSVEYARLMGVHLDGEAWTALSKQMGGNDMEEKRVGAIADSVDARMADLMMLNALAMSKAEGWRLPKSMRYVGLFAGAMDALFVAARRVLLSEAATTMVEMEEEVQETGVRGRVRFEASVGGSANELGTGISVKFAGAAEVIPARLASLVSAFNVPLNAAFSLAERCANELNGKVHILSSTPSCRNVSTAPWLNSENRAARAAKAKEQIIKDIMDTATLIKRKKPIIVLMEQSAGLKSHHSNTYEEVQKILLNLPYAWRHSKVDAACLGAPHHRRRLAWVGVRRLPRESM